MYTNAPRAPAESVSGVCHIMQGRPPAIHFFVQFEPLPGKETALREQLLRVIHHTRREPGCLNIHVFESVREPAAFAIYSEWVDEAAFELHATLPHTVEFLRAVEKLLPRPVQGLRTRKIG